MDDQKIILTESELKTLIQQIGMFAWRDDQEFDEAWTENTALDPVYKAMQFVREDIKALWKACDEREEKLISAKKNLEKINRRLKDNLKQTEELAKKAQTAVRAKSYFLANMSHEIRTPLNGIIGMLAVLMETTTLNEKQKQYTDIIKLSSESLLEVINDILDFSKIEAGKIDLEEIEFNLLETLEKSIIPLGNRASEKGIDLSYSVEPGIPLILSGDPGRIKQVLINLAGNALKFTEKGYVSLFVKKVKEEEGTLTLRFEVEDSGIGISPENRSFLFQRFSQANETFTRKFGGTGLGLAICKGLVELMGGEIQAESEGLNKGSRFSFRLDFKIPEKQIRPDPDIINLFKDTHLLLLSGNPATRQLIRFFCEKWECPVTADSDPEKILTVLKAKTTREKGKIKVIIDGFMNRKAEPLLNEIKRDERIRVKTALISLDYPGKDATHYFHPLPFYNVNKPIRENELLNGLAGKKLNRKTEAGIAVKPKISILLAEDNKINREITLKFLESWNMAPLTAVNGKEALDILSRKKVDLVLMDCEMPVMDGYQTTEIIRNHRSPVLNHRVPVFALTAGTDSKKRILDSGMDGIIEKPIDPDKLRKVINRAMADIQIKEELDTETIKLGTLLSKLAQDNTKLKKLIEGFLSEAEQLLKDLDAALKTQDRETARRNAHTLRGMALNMYIPDMAEIAGKMEHLIMEQGINEETVKLNKNLTDSFRKIEHYLNAYLTEK